LRFPQKKRTGLATLRQGKRRKWRRTPTLRKRLPSPIFRVKSQWKDCLLPVFLPKRNPWSRRRPEEEEEEEPRPTVSSLRDDRLEYSEGQPGAEGIDAPPDEGDVEAPPDEAGASPAECSIADGESRA
jgi:hypothetical protein